MNLDVPLAVRFYNLARGFDFHITKWLEDFSFRHTAPGGCASCTLKLHIPRDVPVDPQAWGKLFTRVQIIDRRDAQVLWEGRIEDPAQRSDEDTWEIGVLGSSVCATDVTIPFIYVDNSLENWKPIEADAYQHTKDEVGKVLITKLNSTYVFDQNTQFGLWTWIGGSKCGSAIARVSCKYNAYGPNASVDQNFDQILQGSIYGNLDVTSFDQATITKVNLMPDDAQFGDGLINQVYFEVRNRAANYTITANDQAVLRFQNPTISTIRCNREGDPLLASADYVHGDFVYVRHVVEDVIGRWLHGNWQQGPSLSDFNDTGGCLGSVQWQNAYVDITDNTKITNLQFPNGATAKQVLETLMGVQTNAYWAIWESDHLWNEDTLPLFPGGTYWQTRFRFEWATWPESWNYVASSADGMDQQISAEDCYSQIYLRQVFETSDEPGLVYSDEDGPWPAPGVVWDTSETFKNQFDRVLFRDDTDSPLPTGTDNFQLAFAEGAQHSFPKNAGTITIRRAIPCYDTGANSYQSTMGMLEPWELRPGKLIMIRDVMPLADAGNLRRGPEQLNINPDFEVNTTGWTSEGGTFVRDTVQKWNGVASGKITPNGTAANVAIFTASKYQALPGESYVISAFVRNAVARNIWIRTRWYNAANALVTTTWAGPLAIPGNTWVQLDTTAVCPAGVVSMDTGIFMGGSDGIPPASNIMWVDGVTLSHYLRLPTSHQNCVFRVAATNYNASDNSCELELDELPKWSVATQIAHPGSGSVSIR